MGMGGSSGGGGTSTVVQQQQIPQYQQDYAIENEDVARQIAAQPYSTYEGQRIAGFTPTQNQASYDVFNSAAGAPLSHWFDTAARGLAGRSGSSYGAAPLGADAIGVDYGGVNSALAQRAGYKYGDTLNPGDIAPWMSPFVGMALQPQLNAVNRNADVTARRTNAGASAAGAFGDARLGIQQGENDRNRDQLLSDVTGTGYQNAYDRAVASAQGAFKQNSDVYFQDSAAQQRAIDAFSRNMAQQHGEQLQSFGAGAGQFNADRDAQLRAIFGLPTVASSEYGYQSQAAKDLREVGDKQQQQDQAGLSMAYQDFINQLQYPQEMLNLRLATQAGSPYSTTRLTTTPYSPTAQSLGALAALFGAFGKPAGSIA